MNRLCAARYTQSKTIHDLRGGDSEASAPIVTQNGRALAIGTLNDYWHAAFI